MGDWTADSQSNHVWTLFLYLRDGVLTYTRHTRLESLIPHVPHQNHFNTCFHFYLRIVSYKLPTQMSVSDPEHGIHR